MDLRVMTARGDEVVAEWDEATAEEDVAEIRREIDTFLEKGYSAFAFETGTRLPKFQPEIREDIFLIAPMAGGAGAYRGRRRPVSP